MVKTDNLSIWAEYERGKDYQVKMGFSSKWPELTNFTEGKQWPPATEKTKYMPRPVINQIDFIVENKSSNILSQALKMVFSPEELPQEDNEQEATELNKAADDMSDMAQNTWNDLDQDTLNEECVSDVLSLGTGIFHYYFDNTVKGGMFTSYVGALRGETIDPMDIFLGNPQLKPSQTQKQPWIIIRTREDIETVKEHAKKNGSDYKNIVSDENDTDENYDNALQDMDKNNKVTCLTKYFRKDGQIYWTKVTKTATVQKERPLAPDGAETPFTLYPVEIVVFKRRNKCTFGRAIIEDIIPNQKALNWGLGMMLLSVQQTAWPKIIAKVQALQQTITNEPGEVLTDNFGQAGIDGIKYMQPPNFSTMPMVLVEKMLDMTRQVTGVTEVTSGEVIGANMAASAIIALQNQAQKPNMAYQKKLYRSIKNIGRIWEMFYKTYYNIPRPIQSQDKEGNEITKVFTGSEYANMGFGLNVDVGAGSIFDESLQVSIIEKMYEKQDITKYQYVRYLPQNAITSEMRQDFEKEEEQMQQQQEMQGQQQIIDQALSELSPEQLQQLEADPQMMEEFVNEIMGGMPNGTV